jgi:hypothetical protein
MDKHKSTDDLPNAPGALLTIDNPRVRHTMLMMLQKVAIVGHDYSTGGIRVGNVLTVIRAEQARVRGSGCLNAATPQSGRDGMRHMLVEQVPNLSHAYAE